MQPQLVTTIPERCRVCYTCVRECPAKAIRIRAGQAEVIAERCIGCGNCVRVCSQQAKQVRSTVERVAALLAAGRKLAACIAPSFPIAFEDLEEAELVGRIKTLGFDWVIEVALGADLVAAAMCRLLAGNPGRRYISSACPAVVGFVQRYHPELIENLTPVVSPMIATARAVHRIHGADVGIVFIGPCIAKKAEAEDPELHEDVDAVLTFAELRALWSAQGLAAGGCRLAEFDPPFGGTGGLLPISRGLVEAADITDRLLLGQVYTAQGRSGFVDALYGFARAPKETRLLDVLACDGCICGPGIQSDRPIFSRQALIAERVRRRMTQAEATRRDRDEQLSGLPLHRAHRPDDRRIPSPGQPEIEAALVAMGKRTARDHLDCGACGYATCREHAVAICEGLAECEMCLPYAIDQLHATVRELGVSNARLADTRRALLHSERLASMGQLAAGIAHEVNNPLGVITMYAHLLLDEIAPGSPMRADVERITHQADRCKKIVAGLLNFARQQKANRQSCDLRELIREAMEAAPKRTGVDVALDLPPEALVAEVDPDQVVQVLLNLISNACDAMPDGGALTVRLQADEAGLSIRVVDTGVGIPAEHRAKVFEPFFTTKPLGGGTGLGLAVSYGIAKIHKGDLTFESNANPAAGPTGSRFCLWLPRTAEHPAGEAPFGRGVGHA